MTAKRPHTDSAGPFVSRKFAKDLVEGEVDSAGSFVEGHVHLTNPRKNLYTIDIRLNSKAKPALLDVIIEDKLHRRLGELVVSDHLRIALHGAQLLPLSAGTSSESHLPATLRFVEGVTILLVSRAGPQGEKEKLFHIWPASNTGRNKRRKQAPNIDYSDAGWFSTPPMGDNHSGVEDGTFGTQVSSAARRGRVKSAEPPVPSSGLAASPISARHPEMTNDAGPSTSVAAPAISSGSRRSSLTTGQSCGETTYAYKTTRRRKQDTPKHPTSVHESPSVVNSAVPPIPVRSTTKRSSDRNSVPPARDPSEPASCGSTSDRNGPPQAKQKSARKRKREEAKRPVGPAATVLTVTREASSTSIESMPVVPTTIENSDISNPSPQDDGQMEMNLDVHSIPTETPPERTSVAESAGEQTRSGEDETSPDQDDPALNMRAGLVVNEWPYTALSRLRNSALMSIIAVVSSAREPKQTQKSDWGTCFSVLDPSVLDSFGGVLYTSGAGIRINCFMKSEQLLPNPKQGDVVLLRQVKVQSWQDNLTGTCYPHTMQWAIYDPRTEEISQPDSNLARDRCHFPPSWPVVYEERDYCAQLVRWWAAVQRSRAERQGTAVQIGGGAVVASERKHVQREHLLISEADPGREPKGYFNCTVEFLHGHPNQVSDIYSIYVTDYTSKPGTSTEHSSEWCPVSLADRVLRIEMWRDEAVSLAQQMNSGEYWSLHNVRMKVSSNGLIEGSFSEAGKAWKLSIAEVDSNQHLRALLQRKKVWEENDANPHVFPHKLFSEVALQSIFDCTVEVLQAEYNPTGTSTLYITDYTERNDLATPLAALWSHGLPERIITLELHGSQSKMADKMEIGAFFTVKHMRLIERITSGRRVVGRIGGSDRLIHKLNANNPNEELENLLKRKKQWKEGAAATKPNDSFTTIARVLKSDKRVGRFRVRARVVGTFPLQLEDCAVRCCKGCSEQLPPGTDICTQCMVSDEKTPETENVFHLFLRLQDERGNAQITVTVDQNSKILDGLTPDDVVDGTGADVVRERLSGYIGNLETVQAASSQGRTLEAKVPVREFGIESWYVGDGEDESSDERVVAYGLL